MREEKYPLTWIASPQVKDWLRNAVARPVHPTISKLKPKCEVRRRRRGKEGGGGRERRNGRSFCSFLRGHERQDTQDGRQLISVFVLVCFAFSI